MAHRLAASAHRFRERCAGGSWQLLFTRGVNVGQEQFVGLLKRSRKVLHQVQRPRIAMRLERHHQTPRLKRTKSVKSRSDLARVMPVIVEYAHAMAGEDFLLAPGGAPKASQRPCDFRR